MQAVLCKSAQRAHLHRILPGAKPRQPSCPGSPPLTPTRRRTRSRHVNFCRGGLAEGPRAAGHGGVTRFPTPGAGKRASAPGIMVRARRRNPGSTRRKSPREDPRVS